MEPFTLTIFLAAVVLTYASIEDIKTREVPDWLSFSFIAAGIGLGIVKSAAELSIAPLLFSLAGLGVGLAIGVLMFYTGQWGGGDSKILMGLGAMLGIPVLSIEPYLQIQTLPLFVSFLSNMLFVSALYGLLFAVYLAAKHFKKVKTTFIEHAKKKRLLLIAILALEIITAVFAAFYLEGTSRALIQTLILLLAFGPILWLFIKSVEESAMKKLVAPNELTEGDWLAEPVKFKNKIICKQNPTGITLEEIAKIKKIYGKKTIKNILIKEGVPFLPSFLITYIVTLAAGSLLKYFLIV